VLRDSNANLVPTGTKLRRRGGGGNGTGITSDLSNCNDSRHHECVANVVQATSQGVIKNSGVIMVQDISHPRFGNWPNLVQFPLKNLQEYLFLMILELVQTIRTSPNSWLTHNITNHHK
jgi:hypothetical protein